MPLLLLEFPHPVCGALFDRKSNPVRTGWNSEKLGDPRHLMRTFRLQGLIGDEQQPWTVTARIEPRCRVLTPRSVGMIQFSSDKSRNKFLQRVVVADRAPLDVEVIFRKHNIARISHHMDHFGIPRIKILMAFDVSRSRHAIQMPLCKPFGIWNQFVDIGKIRVLLRKDQVRDQKTRPGIPLLRIGDEKHIVREHFQVTARMMQANDPFSSSNKTLNHWIVQNSQNKNANFPLKPSNRCSISYAVPVGNQLRCSGRRDL